MAVIGKIQKNSLLLLIVIGLAMLAFIFTDFLKGGGGDVERLDTATLNGEPINNEEYQDLKESYINRSKSDYAYQQKEWTTSAERIAEDNAFNEMIRRTILNEEFEKLGIVCTTDELNDMIHGNHVHPWVLQVPLFNGPSGFSKDSVRNYLTALEIEPEGASPEILTSWKDRRKQWKDFEDELKDARMADKYVTLIRKGLFVNKLEAENQYQALYNKKQVKFVMQRYSDIPIDEVTITDDEVKAYYEEHKNDAEYEQEEARDVQMIYFPIIATDEDKAEIKSELSELKDDFELTQNALGFVYQNSEADFLTDSTSFKLGATEQLAFSAQGGSYPASADEMMQSAEIGDVFGPFDAYDSQNRKEMVAIVKVTGVPTEKQAWVRHILISTGPTRTEERGKAIADSLIRVINANDNFVDMVTLMSDDPGSKSTGGEYKWFNEKTMVPEFTEASFNGPIGKLQLVKTAYGYHIVEVLAQAERKIPTLAVVAKEVKPSENTLRYVEERAYDFIYKIGELEDAGTDSAFNSLALDSNLTVQSARVFLSNDYVIGMTNSERMLKFAFNENTVEGDISDPILDGDKYVIAQIDNSIKEGVPEFDDVIEVMRGPALKDKQAEAYIAKMSGKSSLEDVGAVLTNGAIRTSEVTFDGKAIFNGGRPEPAVIGKLFTDIPAGSMTVPIQGEEGVYVFIVESETPAPETTDLELARAPLRVARLGSADSRVIQALREKADLVDNRRKIRFQ